MKKYFNVYLEFDKHKVDEIIKETIITGGKGYVCSVEGNVLATANRNREYLDIVNGAIVNICDGGSIAFLASSIHCEKLTSYIGADLFINYIKKREFKSFFLGNTCEVLKGLKENLSKIDESINRMRFEELPFRNVDEFDYPEIARMINENNPDIIWVSLGAPKQEIFMSKLLPYINRGVMFGFGAIFNFYSCVDNQRRAPELFLKLKLEWLYRVLMGERRIGKRALAYVKLLPGLVLQEFKQKNL